MSAGDIAGVNALIDQLHTLGIYFVDHKPLKTIIDVTNYMNVSVINHNVYSHYITSCTSSFVNGKLVGTFNTSDPFCKFVHSNHLDNLPRNLAKTIIKEKVKEAVAEGTQAADVVAEATADEVTKAAIETSKKAIDAATTTYYTPIIASIVAIVLIVLIMVIIYKILRYRRKKKMKKKLQYIKLLEE
ncbi:hypothetical protein PFUGPA_00006 [Plasmodium falciparum Palo Alto/Uganda]|uniref:Rifin n=1 Tax=Plasmodium falciparum (isolate Palo Alto / Uganda) TaxID=57270 RepID=W4J8V8_PLAFP|nr:hypothetical protein PFUGPA_00006 [Plasmodium falciparum Palo Alto/Uganda]